METGQPGGIPLYLGPLAPLPLLSDSAALGLQEKEKLAMLERRYHSLTGGRAFPKTTSTLKEVTWLVWAPASGPRGLLGGSGGTHGAFTPTAEVEYGGIFLNWRNLSRNGSEVWDWILYGYRLLLFSCLSGPQEPTDLTISGD